MKPFELKTIRLRFQLGEVELFSNRAPALVLKPEATVGDLDAAARAAYVKFVNAEGADCLVAFGQPVTDALSPIGWRAGCVRFAGHQYFRSTVRLDGTFEDYLAAMPGPRRSRLKRKVTRAAKALFGLRVAVFKTEDEMREFHAIAVALSKKTYQESLFGKGIRTDSDFVSDMLVRARNSATGVRGFVLYGNGEPIAFSYLVGDGEVLLCEMLGYDPKFAEWSPGNVLQFYVLQHLFASNEYSTFDFGEGDSQFKSTFATDSIPCADVFYFRASPVGLALATSQATSHFASIWGARVLQRFGWKAKVKHFLRRAMGR